MKLIIRWLPRATQMNLSTTPKDRVPIFIGEYPRSILDYSVQVANAVHESSKRESVKNKGGGDGQRARRSRRVYLIELQVIKFSHARRQPRRRFYCLAESGREQNGVK